MTEGRRLTGQPAFVLRHGGEKIACGENNFPGNPVLNSILTIIAVPDRQRTDRPMRTMTFQSWMIQARHYACLLLMMAAALPVSRAEDLHAVLIGGGPNPQENQVAIESNV